MGIFEHEIMTPRELIENNLPLPECLYITDIGYLWKENGRNGERYVTAMYRAYDSKQQYHASFFAAHTLLESWQKL